MATRRGDHQLEKIVRELESLKLQVERSAKAIRVSEACSGYVLHSAQTEKKKQDKRKEKEKKSI